MPSERGKGVIGERDDKERENGHVTLSRVAHERFSKNESPEDETLQVFMHGIVETNTVDAKGHSLVTTVKRDA